MAEKLIQDWRKLCTTSNESELIKYFKKWGLILIKNFGSKYIRYLIDNNNIKTLKYCLNNTNYMDYINKKMDNISTPISYGLSYGSYDIIKLLLNYKPNLMNDNLINKALTNNKHPELILTIIKRLYNLGAKSSKNMNILEYLYHQPLIPNVKELANILKNNNCICEWSDIYIGSALKNYQNTTFIEWVFNNSKHINITSKYFHYITSEKVIKLLLKYGLNLSDINYKNDEYKTPIYCMTENAINKGTNMYYQGIKVLLKYGGNPNIKCGDNLLTCMELAINMNNNIVMDILSKYGLNTNLNKKNNNHKRRKSLTSPITPLPVALSSPKNKNNENQMNFNNIDVKILNDNIDDNKQDNILYYNPYNLFNEINNISMLNNNNDIKVDIPYFEDKLTTEITKTEIDIEKLGIIFDIYPLILILFYIKTDIHI